nr:Chain A, PfCSP peptide 20: ASN-PRO-ASP-PRO-ASN-ALA-ASN-PRO-ASN-VAL [Plasmodium falciparum]6B5P_A Chain A, pfCSP peptide 20: ASN-PRO-ASP-PRO-ASN-ALA-ASN-PRO-ASN-VAL-ASP [Plasmodium falciparum]
NPDPNANPNVD